MLARLKRGSRRYIALVWAMMLVFVLAPVVSVAYGAPAGVFSTFLLHSHALGGLDHAHHDHARHHSHDHGRHHHGRPDHDHKDDHDDATDDDLDDPGHDRLHVHYDTSYPSVLTSVPTPSVLYRVVHRVVLPPVDARQGAPPGRLFRPPILPL